MPHGRPWFLLALALVSSSCRPPAAADTPRALLTVDGERAIDATFLADPALHRLDVVVDDALALVARGPLPSATPGATVELVLYWQVRATPRDPEALKVFVHAVAPGGELPIAQADHRLHGGALDPGALRPGDVVEDRFSLVVPREATDRLAVRVGLYAGKRRFPVTHGAHDGQNRVEIAELVVEGGLPALPRLAVPRRASPITVDGVLDEPAWATAAITAPFLRHDGRARVRQKTTARLLWDDDALYVAFEAEDADVHTPYTKRDDPLYESEAVEVFIDADGDRDVYVELQAAPNDLHFDAAFAGGRRKGFDTSYDHDYQTKTRVDGTLNDPSDVDRGFVSEWRIPFAGLRDVERPTAGTTWKVNLFRLDRLRKDGRVTGSEATAWSSPHSGDFHNLDRFGTIDFTP